MNIMQKYLLLGLVCISYALSADQQKAAEFGAYFNELIKNPKVIDRDAALAEGNAINQKGAIEELFKKLCEKHNLIEKSPVFVQHRWTRPVVVSAVTVSEAVTTEASVKVAQRSEMHRDRMTRRS